MNIKPKNEKAFVEIFVSFITFQPHESKTKQTEQSQPIECLFYACLQNFINVIIRLFVHIQNNLLLPLSHCAKFI